MPQKYKKKPDKIKTYQKLLSAKVIDDIRLPNNLICCTERKLAHPLYKILFFLKKIRVSPSRQKGEGQNIFIKNA